MSNLSIRVKVAVAAIAFVAAVALAVTLPLRQASQRAVELAGEDALRAAAMAFASIERGDKDKLSLALDTLMADPALIAPFRERNRDRLIEVTAPIFQQLKAKHGITNWYFIDPDRTCFLRVHAPALFGDRIERDSLAQAIARGDMAAGKELGKSAFALRVVKPIRAGGQIVGYMELGEEIDHFLEHVSQQIGSDIALLVEKQRIDRKELARVRHEDRWDERPDLVLIVSTTIDDKSIQVPVAPASMPAGGVALGEWLEGTRSFVRGAFPVRDATDRVVGAMFVRHEITALRDGFAAGRNRVLWIAIATAMLASLVLVALANRLGLERLRRVADAMDGLSARISSGEPLVAPPGRAAPSGDEIGRVERAFERLADVVAGALGRSRSRTG